MPRNMVTYLLGSFLGVYSVGEVFRGPIECIWIAGLEDSLWAVVSLFKLPEDFEVTAETGFFFLVLGSGLGLDP